MNFQEGAPTPKLATERVIQELSRIADIYKVIPSASKVKNENEFKSMQFSKATDRLERMTEAGYHIVKFSEGGGTKKPIMMTIGREDEEFDWEWVPNKGGNSNSIMETTREAFQNAMDFSDGKKVTYYTGRLRKLLESTPDPLDLMQLQLVYGIGKTTSVDFWNNGITTIEDLKLHVNDLYAESKSKESMK